MGEGGVYVSSSSSFTKTSGIIYGNNETVATLRNVVKTRTGVVLTTYGAAVYTDATHKRETTVSTGQDMSRTSDGTGTAARFHSPASVAVDTAGTVYVADRNNHRIRKITPTGVVTTLAESGTVGTVDGTGTAAQLNIPCGVAVDAAGTVYVADMYNNRIRKITPTGVVTTLAGSGTSGYADGAGTVAQFSSPLGVAIDTAGNVYVASNNRIRKITTMQ